MLAHWLRSICIAQLAVLSSVPFAFAQAPAQDPQKISIDQAVAYCTGTRWEDAIEACSLLWNRYDLSDETRQLALSRRADAYLAMKEWGKAVADLSTLAEIKRDDPAHRQRQHLALRSWGEAMHAAGNATAAIALYDRAMQLLPDDPATLLQRGTARLAIGDLGEGIADLRSSVKLRPDDVVAIKMLAMAYRERALEREKRNALDAALDDLNHAVELVPKDATVLSERGLLHEQRNALDAALADYDAALAIDPKIAAVHVRRGFLLVLRDDHKGAVAAFTAAIELDPTIAEAHAARAIAHEALDNRDGAIGDARAALRLSAGNQIALAVLGRLGVPAPAKASPAVPRKGPEAVTEKSAPEDTGRPKTKKQQSPAASKARPHPVAYSTRIWPYGAISTGATATQMTPYGRLTCTGGSLQFGQARVCRWN